MTLYNKAIAFQQKFAILIVVGFMPLFVIGSSINILPFSGINPANFLERTDEQMAKTYESYGIEEIGGVPYYVGYKKSIPSFGKKSKSNDEPKFDKGGLEVWVKERIYVFDKKKHYFRLKYLTSANGEYEECDYDPQTDTYQTLRGKGVDVTYNTFPILEEWIQQ